MAWDYSNYEHNTRTWEPRLHAPRSTVPASEERDSWRVGCQHCFRGGGSMHRHLGTDLGFSLRRMIVDMARQTDSIRFPEDLSRCVTWGWDDSTPET